jgi:hypothetical protein
MHLSACLLPARALCQQHAAMQAALLLHKVDVHEDTVRPAGSSLRRCVSYTISVPAPVYQGQALGPMPACASFFVCPCCTLV